MEPIVQAVSGVANNAVQQELSQQTNPQGFVDPADQAQFEQLLDAGNVDPVQVQQTQVVTDPQAIDGKVVESQSLGDALISGIENIKSTYDVRADRVQSRLKVLAENPLSVQEAMSVHFELVQLNLHQELTSKMADKVSNGVQTLFRNQG